MGTVRSAELRKEAVRIALTSVLARKQIADDLGVGLSTLTKWANAHPDTDAVSPKDRKLARETERLRRVIRTLKDLSGSENSPVDCFPGAWGHPKKATQFIASQKPWGSGSSKNSVGPSRTTGCVM
jgi:transposase